MQKLLFLSHRIPFPPDKGDKIRSFHFLRHLSSRFSVYLGCFFDDASDERYIAPLRGLCTEVFCRPLTRSQKMVRALGGLAAGKSMSEGCYRDAPMRSWVRDTLARHDIRNAFVFCSAMYPYMAGHGSDMRVVIDMVDVDSEKWASYARSTRWPLRLLYQVEQRRVLALEKRAGAHCDRAFFVSQAEVDTFAKLAPELSGRVSFLENGVDLDRFTPVGTFPNPFEANALPIVFTGAMDYRPNVDAVVWFAHNAFPAIRRRHERAQFWVVGAHAATAVRALSGEPGVTVTGAVADVRPYIANASCVVAPLRIARGVQNKVLEAMAMAKPVVATAAALDGLRAVPGREVLEANDVSEFAGMVSGVLAGGARDIGRAARARVESDYRWPEKLRALDELFPRSSETKAPAQPAGNSEPYFMQAMS